MHKVEIFPISDTFFQWDNWFLNILSRPQFLLDTKTKYTEYAKALMTATYCLTKDKDPVSLLRNTSLQTMRIIHFVYLVHSEDNKSLQQDILSNCDLTCLTHSNKLLIAGTLKDYYLMITNASVTMSELYNDLCNRIQIQLEYDGLALIFDKYVKVKSKTGYWTLK